MYELVGQPEWGQAVIEEWHGRRISDVKGWNGKCCRSGSGYYCRNGGATGMAMGTTAREGMGSARLGMGAYRNRNGRSCRNSDK